MTREELVAAWFWCQEKDREIDAATWFEEKQQQAKVETWFWLREREREMQVAKRANASAQ
jgi:hypothetical protein